MIITLKDGSSKEYAQPMSVYEIAADISEGLARAACAGEIDGKVEDLRTVIDKDCNLNILTANDEAGLRVPCYGRGGKKAFPGCESNDRSRD